MKVLVCACFMLVSAFGFSAENVRIDGIPLVVRPPSVVDETSRIMVLFGERNWQGDFLQTKQMKG